MCFPGKRQKALFSDKPKAAKQAPASAPAKESPTPTLPTSDPTAVSTHPEKMSSPRVAIIIYSMYGHVSTSESVLFCGAFVAEADQNTRIVAEHVLKGIQEAGGSATIYQ